VLDARGDLLLYLRKISRRTSQCSPPEHPVVHCVYGLQRHLNVFASDQKMAGDQVRHSKFLSCLLQIDVRADIFAGCGEGTDRQRRVKTQSGRNVVCESEPEKVEVFGGACVLEGENCNWLWTPGLNPGRFTNKCDRRGDRNRHQCNNYRSQDFSRSSGEKFTRTSRPAGEELS
jgi:hypothetical protein